MRLIVTFWGWCVGWSRRTQLLSKLDIRIHSQSIDQSKRCPSIVVLIGAKSLNESHTTNPIGNDPDLFRWSCTHTMYFGCSFDHRIRVVTRRATSDDDERFLDHKMVHASFSDQSIDTCLEGPWFHYWWNGSQHCLPSFMVGKLEKKKKKEKKKSCTVCLFLTQPM